MCTPETVGVLEALGPAFAQCAENLPALSGAGDTLDRAKDWVSLFEPGSDLMANCLAEKNPAEGARADPGIDSSSHAKTAKLTSWAWAEGMDLILSRASWKGTPA